MRPQTVLTVIGILTPSYRTLVRLEVLMPSLVIVSVADDSEIFLAILALIGPYLGMCPNVHLKVLPVVKAFPARLLRGRINPLASMSSISLAHFFWH